MDSWKAVIDLVSGQDIYPEDRWPPLTTKEWRELVDLLEDNGFDLDQIAACISRDARSAVIYQIYHIKATLEE